ncbi:NADP-dependent oxidoreductase [Pseudomonas indica]|uniref:NADP-dependent oxidoreductase n=1 Tax=Pseudomonas indica TaxID=137658 RepID=UPI003FD630F5
MKAFIIDRYDGIDCVRASEMPIPELGEDDVLIRVVAAGVNPLDAKIRSGKLKFILPYRLPLILGHDVAGEVVGVGARVRQFKLGDEVYARADQDRIGAFAEFIAIKEEAVAQKPDLLSMEEAASIPIAGLTAWQALVEKAGLKRGQKVLIHAGSGGVGTLAIQLAKHIGATVATTTSTANLDWVKGLGADSVIDYRKDDFETLLRDYDVVLDTLGGKTLEKSLRVLKPGGKAIGIVGPPDPEFANAFGLNGFLRMAIRLMSHRVRREAQRHGVSYSFLFMRPSGDQLRELRLLIDSGAIRPVVDRIFPFESTKAALAYLEEGHAKGKVVIRVKENGRPSA